MNGIPLGARFIPWPTLPDSARAFRPPDPAVGTPLNADGTPNYAYLQIGEWWNRPEVIRGCCARGFVRDARFQRGTEQIIPGTNRAKTKASRAMVDRERQARFGK